MEEERWRVAADGIVLNLSNGALLTRAQKKVRRAALLTLKKIENPDPP